MQTAPKITVEKVKPSRFFLNTNFSSISTSNTIETRSARIHKKPRKNSLIERRRLNKYNFEPNVSDEADALEQKILKWLEENNIVMVFPEDKEHEYMQNNINSVFEKMEKKSFSSVQTSHSNSNSPHIVVASSFNNSPRLNINDSPLMKKRMVGTKSMKIGRNDEEEKENTESEGKIGRTFESFTFE